MLKELVIGFRPKQDWLARQPPEPELPDHDAPVTRARAFRRRYVNSAVLLAALLMSSSCASPSSTARKPRLPPVQSSWLSPPGTPLWDGFEVGSNDWLLGSLFPERMQGPDGETWTGWSAYLLLAGGQEASAARYLGQARSAGFKGDSRPQCSRIRETTVCEATAQSSGRGESETRALAEFQAFRADRGLNGWPVSLGRLRVTHFVESALDSTVEAPRLGESPPPAPGPSELPRARDELGRLQFRVDGRKVGETLVLNVERGSDLVAAPAVFDGSLGPTLVAILRLSGKASSIAEAYGRQAAAYYPVRSRQRWSVGGWKLIQDDLECPGGCGTYEARIVIEESDAFLALFATVRS